MLSKVNKDNWNLGTNQIIKYSQLNNLWDQIQDNLEGNLLVKYGKKIFLFDYNQNLIIKNVSIIRLNILNIYFWKQIESFDQNNIKISNQIRSYVITQFISNNTDILLGIGGESYIYCPFIKSNSFIGISNHKSIITDADFNLKFYTKNYSNYLVDYSNISSFPNLNYKLGYNIIINVSKLLESHIEYIKNLYSNKVVIITCTPIYKKIPLIKKYFRIEKIKHFLNINSWVTVLVCSRVIDWITLGSNCSITYQLNKHNLRLKSYPFDWAKITLKQLINVLENNFISYTDFQKIKLSSLHLKNEINPTLLIENNYGIKFAHEIIDNLDSKIEEFKIKLLNRIERFRNLKNKQVKFVRIELNNISIKYFESINVLINLLDNFILSYQLILIINSNIDINQIKLDKRIQVYKFNSFDSNWKMDKLNWKNIFLPPN